MLSTQLVEENKRIPSNLGRLEQEILHLLARKPSSSSELAKQIGVSPRTIKEHYKALKAHRLVRCSEKGAELTQKGRELFSNGIVNSGEVKWSEAREESGEDSSEVNGEISEVLRRKSGEAEGEVVKQAFFLLLSGLKEIINVSQSKESLSSNGRIKDLCKLKQLKIGNLKQFALANLPATSSLRDLILAEKAQLEPQEFLAKLDLWLKLLSKEF
jgi:DNA-binding MarR family transcriptional regulator